MVPCVPYVKNLGVTLDQHLSMSQHVYSNTRKAAYIQIRYISFKRHILTIQANQTLVCSLVLSRLDLYCNSLLTGCPMHLLDKLQKAQHLPDLLQPYMLTRQLCSASDTRTFAIPRVNMNTFGERSFSYAGPSLWNSQPQPL